MLSAITDFFTIETIVFCIVIWIFSLIIRRVVQALAKKLTFILPDKWEPYVASFWRDHILPYLPWATGGVMAWQFEDYPYPEVLVASVSGRIFFGIVCGVISGRVYRHFKPLAKKLLPEKIREIEEKLTEGIGPLDEETLPGEEAEKQLEETTEE